MKIVLGTVIFKIVWGLHDINLNPTFCILLEGEQDFHGLHVFIINVSSEH